MEEKNIIYRTRIHYIIPSQELINEARLSNNIYNQALYILRQAFANEEKLPSKFDLVKTLRHKEYECKEYNNFSKMVSCNAEAIINSLLNNIWFIMLSDVLNKNIAGDELTNFKVLQRSWMLWGSLIGSGIGVWINNSISIEFALILQAISTVLIAICDGYSFKKLERIAYK